MTVQTVLRVEGMTCAGCVARVESVIDNVPGVETANVNLATGRAAISYIEGVSSDADFRQAISAAGYGVSDFEGPETKHSKQIAGLLRDVVFSVCLTLPLLAIAKLPLIPALADVMYGLFPKEIWSFIELSLVTPVVIGAGRRFIRAGWVELRHFNPGMNSLVMIGAGAAYFYSIVGLFWPKLLPSGAAQSYFVASAVIITFILIGRYLEELARGRISRSIDGLLQLEPQFARTVKNGTENETPIHELRVGDVLVIRPGERLAADGVIVEGESQINEAMVTGESVPVSKKEGSEVIAGTVNLTGAFTYRATGVGNNTVLRRIMDLVEQAQNDKTKVQRFADKVASIFVPFVILTGAVTFILWLLLGGTPALGFAFMAAISVLLIACPCAMGLATPTAIMVGTYRGVEDGVLIRSGSALESLGQADTIIFDKTGTLTIGEPTLVDLLDPNTGESIDADRAHLATIAAVEQYSEHPLSRAIVNAARAENSDLPLASEFMAVPGKGVSAIVDSSLVLVGTNKFLEGAGVDLVGSKKFIEGLANQGKTRVFASIGGVAIAILGIGDAVRPESKSTVAALKELGLNVGMITGDNAVTANVIASDLGIDDVFAETLPGEKANEIQKLQKAGQKVVFVGDGINDAPALVTANTGVAIGTGTDVAVEAAEIVLMSEDVRSVAKAVTLARATLRTIRYNFLWAYGYNIALIPVAAGVFFPLFGWLLNPMLAAAAMSISSVFVITNSLRLRSLRLPFSR